MAGCWTAGGSSEMWMKPDGEKMLGVGRTIRAGKVVSTEFMQISREGNGEVVFTAQQKFGGAFTNFKMAEFKNGSVTFANPQHDFPKRVMYRREADGSLSARIDGGADSKSPPPIEWRFARTKCE